MPRYTTKTRQNEDRTISANIAYHAALLGINNVLLAKSTGIKQATLYSRLKNPCKFTVGELRQICQILNVKLTDLFTNKKEEEK